MVQHASLVCVTALAVLGRASGTKSFEASGVEKVIHMLADMSVHAQDMKKAEQVEFAKFSTWCAQEQANLKSSIKTNTEDIELLEAEIGKLHSEVVTLSKQIAKLDSAVTKHEADKKSETTQREKDHKDFLAESGDYAESVDALERAIQTLQKEDYDRTGVEASLLELTQRKNLPAKAKSVISSFIGTKGGTGDDDSAPYDAPEANAYEFQSSNIVEMLKNLRDDFKGRLATSRKEEMNSKHAYDMIVTDLVDAIENKKGQSKAKSAEKDRKSEKAAQNKKQLAATASVKAENAKTLSSTDNECQEKTLSFKEKQGLRGEEIEAIAKAIEILKSPEVSGSAEKHLGLAQRGAAGASFAQLASGRAAAAGGRHRVREFLESEGKRLHSQRLALLAQAVAADPFAKVKQLIGAMITRLMGEANQDAKHEGFCDTEMGKSKQTRTKLSEEIDGFSAAVEDGKATITELGESTAALQEEIEALVKSMGEAAKLRQEEKATNKETVKDAKAAQKAVAAATAVLKKFYDKSLAATALLQVSSGGGGVKMGSDEWVALANPAFKGSVDKGHKEGMQTFGETYQGQQDEKEYGVLALLEVVQSDFANLEANTLAAEAAAQKTFKSFMVESKRNQAVKEKKVSMNDADKAAAQSKLQEDIADLKATQDGLLAADRYYEKLVPQCIDQGMTFEERTGARAAEIASLKEALKILSNEDIATSAF